MTEAADKSFESISIGEIASFDRIVTAADLEAFAELSGDRNPLHMDDGYAAGTQFGERVVHGMFLGILLSRIIGMYLPGKRALLMKESLDFKKPVRIGDMITACGRVTNKSESTRIVEMEVSFFCGDELVASGCAHARVLTE